MANPSAREDNLPWSDGAPTRTHLATLGNHVIERRLGVVSTARNVKTIRDVLVKADALT